MSEEREEVEIVSTHIQVTVRCPICKNEWDVDDYDSNSVDASEDYTKTNEYCRSCNNNP